MQSFIGCKRGKVRNNADKRLHNYLYLPRPSLENGVVGEMVSVKSHCNLQIIHSTL